MAEIIGEIQMFIFLSVIYWTLVALLAIPFRFYADPLALRKPSRARWVHRQPATNVFEALKRQG